PRALLGDVADAGGRATFDAGSCERVLRTVVAGAVAVVGDVAGAGGRAAETGALHVGGTVGTRARAPLLRVARAGRRGADRDVRREAVDGTVVARAVARLGDVADARGGPAHRGRLRVDGADAAGAGARLLHVAGAHRRATDGAGRRERARRRAAVAVGRVA